MNRKFTKYPSNVFAASSYYRRERLYKPSRNKLPPNVKSVVDVMNWKTPSEVYPGRFGWQLAWGRRDQYLPLSDGKSLVHFHHVPYDKDAVIQEIKERTGLDCDFLDFPTADHPCTNFYVPYESLDLGKYTGKGFDTQQEYQIYLGLDDVDVSVYARPEYNWRQMEQIRRGLESGVDVSIYADPKVNEDKMREFRLGLQSGVDVSWYADPEYNWRQMEQIREGLESGIDVTSYADPSISFRTMRDTKEKLQGQPWTLLDE